MSLWVSLSGNTEFYILLRWHCCPWAFVKCRSGCGLLTLIENDWKHCVESFIKSCRHAAPCLTEADLLWMVVHWKTVHYVLDSEVENRSLHVLSTAQAGAESSVTAWSTWLCGWLVCFGGGLVRGRGHHTPDVWWRWLDGLLYCVYVFFFFFFLIVVPSYLLVHSICTKKLDWWAAVCLFWEEWNSVFFFFLSAVVRLAYVL